MAVKREKVVQTAEKYVQRGKINAAIREYRKVLAEHPDDAMTLNRVGDLYARSEQIEEAIGLFTQIAENYTADGFFPKATAIYKKIIKLDPTRLGVYEKLAELYHRQGLLNEARTQYQVLADYYVKHDNTTSATAIYERMTDVDPEDPSLRVRLAELYQEQKFLDKAMSQYRDIAALMLEHGSADDAEAVLLKGLDVDSEDLDFIEDGVQTLRQAGAEAAAARFLARAVESNPEAAAIAEQVGAAAGADEDRVDAEAVSSDEAEVADELGSEQAAGSGADVAASVAEPELVEDPVLAVDDEVDLVLDADADLELDPELTGVGMARGSMEATATPDAEVEEGTAHPEPTAVDSEPDPFDTEITLDLEGIDFDEDGLPAFEEEAEPASVAEEAAEESGAIEDAALDASDVASALDERGTDPVVEAAPATAAPRSLAPAPGSIDPDFLERTAAELHPEQIQQEEDLLTEAEVLVKYGLTEKATERLGELLALNAEHVGGRALLIRLHLDQGNEETAAELATELAASAGGTETWAELWGHMEPAGFTREADGPVIAPAPLAPQATDAIGETRETGFALGGSSGAARDESSMEDTAIRFADLEAELDTPFFDIDDDADAIDSGAASEETSEMGAEVAPAASEAVAAPDQASPGEPPLPEPAVEDPVAQELSVQETAFSESAVGEVPASEVATPVSGEADSAPPKRKRRRPSVDDMLASLTDGVLPRRRRKAESTTDGQVSDEIDGETSAAPGATTGDSAPPSESATETAAAASEMASAATPEAEAPPASAEAIPEPPPAADPPTEASPDWLEHTVTDADPESGGLFADEDDFFDLAAELEEELSQEGALAEHDELLLETPREQSLEEIVEGFKKGVSENLSEEDHNTHFDLGIAYREMGLLDEAIGEFQVAAKNPDLLVECCSMLGLSFLEKGLPELAVKWYRRGLDVPGLPEEKHLGLLYDLGNTYMAIGDMAQAHATFIDIYGTNSNYRDVVAKIEETRPR